MKILDAICRLPFIRPSGGVVCMPGYDEETRIYAEFDPDHISAVPQEPTRDQITGALQTIMHPWSQYRFASAEDKGAMLAAVLTAVCRPALDTSPGFFFDAPQQSSGKTKAAEALGALIKGHRPGITPFVGGPQSDAELVKRIVSMLLIGENFCLIDNVVGYWNSPVLAGWITSGQVNERVLGSNSWFKGCSRLLVTATGNNAEMGLDLGRRFVRVRIDAGVECPQARSFPFDPIQAALSERLAIAHAVLVLVQAYHAAGAPEIGRGDAGGFSAWNRLVRRPVLWLIQGGYTDEAGLGPLGDPAACLMENAASADPESVALRTLLGALRETFNGEPFTSRDVLVLFNQSRGEVFDALYGILGGRRDVSSASIARTLQHRRDRISAGLVLRKLGEDRQGAIWRVGPG